MTILLDFESRSRADLKRIGGRLYWEHESTEALCCVLYDTTAGDVGLWLPGDPCPVAPGDDLAAHNAMGFDRFAAARVWGTPIDAPWIDTSQLAKRAGLPGKLDALGTRWLGLPKDRASSKFTRSLSTRRRPSGKGNPNAITPAAWKALDADQKRRLGVQRTITPDDLRRVVGYCASDVEIMAHGWDQLESWRDLEPHVQAAERTVNDRGVAFDADLARALLRCDAENVDRVCADVARELGWTPAQVRAAARSPQQFCEITGALNAQKETVACMASSLSENYHPLARAREALASIARGKLDAGLARVSADGRMRDVHNYYGAHTGRWSGRGMQLQNMPRPAKRFEDWGDDEICREADRVLAGGAADDGLIDVLLRACIVPRPGHVLVTCDFAGVEARALAWVADDRGALDVFASGRDPYKTAAATIFGVDYSDIDKVQRGVGKVAELACGYGMGAKKFYANNHTALMAAGVDADDVVQAWRKLHAPIVRFWWMCEDAFRAATLGYQARVDRFTFSPSHDGRDVAIFLPSGRPIVYNNARMSAGWEYQEIKRYVSRMHDADVDLKTEEDYRNLEDKCKSHAGTAAVLRKPGSLTYHGTRGEEHTYGGKIVENVIQAMCRDLLAEAMVKCEAAGLPVVLHVHDELVIELPEQAASEGLEYLRAIMLDLPEWAETFPVNASGHFGRRYRK